jgi:putative FmdB family regulatory protein
MPIYEYECKLCKYKFDITTKTYTVPKHRKCPKCPAMARRIFGSAPSVQLKGDCWSHDGYEHEPPQQRPKEGDDKWAKDALAKRRSAS